MCLDKIEGNIEWGTFFFDFKSIEGNEFSISLDACSDISQILEMFVSLINNETKHIEDIEDEGYNSVFYTECLENEKIRFFIANVAELYRSFCKNEIDDYSYKDAEINLDIIINKKTFIEQFYKKLSPLINNLDDIDFIPYGNGIEVERCKTLIPIIKQYVNN